MLDDLFGKRHRIAQASLPLNQLRRDASATVAVTTAKAKARGHRDIGGVSGDGSRIAVAQLAPTPAEETDSLLC